MTLSKPHNKQENHHHHSHFLGIKKFFGKEQSPESDSSNLSTGISKLMGRDNKKEDKDQDKEHDKESTSKNASPASSIISMRKKHSNSPELGKEGKLHSKDGVRNFFGRHKGEKKYVTHHEKIVYNPFGINNMHNFDQAQSSFYGSGGNENRVLSNPVADPNEYIPQEMSQKHVNLLDDFEIDFTNKKLGDGGSAIVHIVNLKYLKKTLFALKKITLFSKETEEEYYSRASQEYIMSKYASKSRHVVDVLALMRVPSQKYLTRGWAIVMDYCEGGDLYSNIIKSGWKGLKSGEKYCMFKQICYALKFLHDHGIAHKDMKAENVLIDRYGIAKLCDFGVSEFANEVEGDPESPVKYSTSYVGSPPYTSPEVMKLRNAPSVEIKHLAYDPYKMDCWGLGMLLFCVVYRGLPFSSAVPDDPGYRDYKFNHERFQSNHPNFKNNDECNKGPGVEFRWSSQFDSSGASRVAWKLCNPNPEQRYTIPLLFKDPWFLSLEMCIYEDPDQDVNGIVAWKNQSVSSANSGSVPLSRKGTFSSLNENHEPHVVKSMVDIPDEGKDNASVKSSSSLSYLPSRSQANEKGRYKNSSSRNNHFEESDRHKADTQLDADNGSSAFSFGASNAALPNVKEEASNFEEEGTTEGKHEGNLVDKTEPQEEKPNEDKPNKKEIDSKEDTKKEDSHQEKKDEEKSSESDNFEIDESMFNDGWFKWWGKEKPPTEVSLDSNGICDLGYKLRKHNHRL